MNISARTHELVAQRDGSKPVTRLSINGWHLFYPARFEKITPAQYSNENNFIPP